MSKNLRFNAVPDRGPYMYREPPAEQRINRKISFGKGSNAALVIDNDCKRVQSRIGPPEDKSTCFIFGDELFTTNKVDSIIPGKNDFEPPAQVEIWAFPLRPNPY